MVVYENLLLLKKETENRWWTITHFCLWVVLCITKEGIYLCVKGH